MIGKSLAFLALIGLVVTACNEEVGPALEAVIEPEGETSGFSNFVNGTDKSFGIFVCSNDGPVELQSIESLETEGEIELLGALVYVSEDRFVGAAHGYPPAGLDVTRTEPVEGAVVDSDCDGPSGEERVQLLVGAERSGPGGGVIDGLRVGTNRGALEIPFTILLCGDAMEYCEVLEPPDGS